LFYNLTEYNLWLPKNDIKSYDINIKKGLAALVDDEYKYYKQSKITLITKDDFSSKSLETWFGKNSELKLNY
jgi:hypothetical protein